MDVLTLAKEIVAGRRLTRSDNLNAFLTCDLQQLCEGADYIRSKLCGDKVDLCTIINARSGRCPENCKYCAQSIHNHTNCEVYSLLDAEKVIAEAKANEAEGVDRFAMVTSGRSLSGEEFDKALEIYKRLKAETKLNLCASMGFLTREQFKRLRAAGVTSYHHNIETSQRNFPNICTTHSYQMKIDTIKIAQSEGFCVCSGGIIGMGETWEDRLDMAISLFEAGVRSIPINVLMPIPGSPLEHMPPIPEEDALRTFAFFRYMNPTANIRLAAGRLTMINNGERVFKAGASATITGNMLTTSGSTIRGDREMLEAMGRDVQPVYGTTCGNHDCACCGPVDNSCGSTCAPTDCGCDSH